MLFDPIILYACLAVAGGLPIFLMVATFNGETLNAARKRTLDFLERWGGIAPAGLQKWVTFTLGSTVGFALIWGLSQILNTCGKEIVPQASALFDHFGKTETKWSVEYRRDWDAFLNEVRRQWSCKYPDTDLMVDRQTFYDFKSSHGASPVRAMRTLFMYAGIMVVAGFLDLRLKRYRKRGVGVVLIGLVAVLGFTFSWSLPQETYVNEVFVINTTLENCKAEEPTSKLALE